MAEQMVIPEIQKGDEMMEAAREWCRRNREAWWWMCMTAAERASKGERFGIADLAEEVRWRKRAEGDPFKLNNTLRAPLARLLIAQYPHVAPYIETRKSKADAGR